MINITYDKLDPERLTQAMRSSANGAVVTFLGTTRDSFDGKKVIRLEYEAYEEMAIKKLHEIRKEIQQQFSIEDIAISHRIGVVDISEISLAVVVSSPHRKGVF